MVRKINAQFEVTFLSGKVVALKVKYILIMPILKKKKKKN